jgi:hypothetical protein
MFGNADMLRFLDPSLPQRKLCQNLLELGVVDATERLQVERLNNYALLNGAGEFAVSRTHIVLNSRLPW